MAKTKEQIEHEADLLLIEQAEAELRAAEERKRKLEEAKARVADFERKQRLEDAAKSRADGFISAVLSVGWTESDHDIIRAFPAAQAKQARLDELMVNAADPTYWVNVPKAYAKKLREAAKGHETECAVDEAIVLNLAADSVEVN